MIDAAIPWLHRLGQLSRGKAAREFDRAVRDPGTVQERYLRDLLRRNEGTLYGREYGFAGIAGGKEFAQRVPLIEPQGLQPWVKREMEGEGNVLTAERPIYYATTSGSTAEPKYLPITERYRVELQKTVHVSVWHLFRRFPDAFRGRALYFVGSRRAKVAPDGCDIGSMSGFNFTELPATVRAIYAWPYELFEVKDHWTRNTLALLLATVGAPSLIAGVYPASVVYLLRELSERAGELAGYLREGVLPPAAQLTEAQREFFQARLGKPQPRFADRLERAAKAPEEQRVSVAWSELRLVYCWLTSTAALFAPELKRRLGPGIQMRDAIYSACEGWCSIPLGDEESGGVLAVTSHYFEFIEEAAFDRGERTTLLPSDVKEGRRYYIVVTTGAGLYRYVLGDIVEVYGWYHQTPRIRFVRKGGAAANLLGEKLDEAVISGAMAGALAEVGRDSTFFTVSPIPPGAVLGYRLYLELSPGASMEDASRVTEACERLLRRDNFEYDRLRKSNQLASLELVALKPGTHDRMRRRMVESGSAEAQLKIAHLVASHDKLAPELQEAGAVLSG